MSLYLIERVVFWLFMLALLVGAICAVVIVLRSLPKQQEKLPDEQKPQDEREKELRRIKSLDS